MTSNSLGEDHSDRLNDILLEYVEACEAGKVPDREAIVSSHPEYDKELRLFFGERDRLERIGGFVRHNKFRHQHESDSESLRRSAGAGTEAISGQLGDFRLIREVGRGGMGIVYEAEQISLGRQVAVKVLPFAAALDPRQLQRFKNEASAAAHLRHENIVSVHAVGCERGVHFFAMQFVDGQSLSSLIAELRQRTSSTPGGSTVAVAHLSTGTPTGRESKYDWIARLGQQAAFALEHAHQTGVIHRDVKPGNLLLDSRGQLWVTDFGLAQMVNDGGLTMTGELLGTLRYASPEQTLGRRGMVDHRSDIFSLGATLYELLTLRPPFDGSDRHELLRQINDEDPPSLRSIDADIPESLETIVLKTLRKDPADRYAVAQELGEDLQRFLERKPINARPPGITELFWGWSRRHPASLLVGIITLIVTTVASILIAVLVGAEQERTRLEQQRTQSAYRAERLRAEEAESRFRLARRAVDELLHVSEEDLADRPEMVILRKRVLRSALSFYQEFLTDRKDNPKARVELQETANRVEQILADLEVLRASTHVYLLCQPHVLKDLRVTDQQAETIQRLATQVRSEWMESFKDIGLASPSERTKRTLSQARGNEARINTILNEIQQDRLRQIGLQSEGAMAFRDQEVANTIGLTKQQREQIRVIEDDAAFGWMRGPAGLGNQSGKTELSFRSPSQRILDVLTAEQIRIWREMTGAPLDQPLISFPGTASMDE